MQVNRFDGGLSTRLDSSLIEPSEAVIYSNIDNTDVTLKSALSYTRTAIEARDSFYLFKGKWLESYTYRNYIEYDNVLYFTEGLGIPKKTADGINIYFLGIAAPLDTPYTDDDEVEHKSIRPVAANPIGDELPISGSDIVVQYCYTYYNNNDNTESAPSSLSVELPLTAGKVVVLDNITPSVDPQVTHIRIYRLGLTTTMQLVKQIPNNLTTVRDAVSTTSLGDVLESYDYNQAPAGLTNLVQAYGILFASKGTSLYFSKIGKPNYWPATQSYLIESDITGLLPVANGIFIFTINKTFMLTGTTIADFAIVPVSDEQGCISHKSCKLVRNTPVWASLDGICQWASGYVQVLSKDKLGRLNLTIKNTAVWDETYFICDTSGNILSMDLRFNSLVFKNLDYLKNITDIGTFNGNLYAIVDERVATMFTGPELTLYYKSPLYTEGSITQVKLYNILYIRYKGDFELKLFIDSVQVGKYSLTGEKTEEIKLPQELQRGYSFQVEIVGIGKVWEYEYKVVGRNNGR